MTSAELVKARYQMELSIHEAIEDAMRKFERETGLFAESIIVHTEIENRIGSRHPASMHVVRVEAVVRV